MKKKKNKQTKTKQNKTKTKTKKGFFVNEFCKTFRDRNKANDPLTHRLCRPVKELRELNRNNAYVGTHLR